MKVSAKRRRKVEIPFFIKFSLSLPILYSIASLGLYLGWIPRSKLSTEVISFFEYPYKFLLSESELKKRRRVHLNRKEEVFVQSVENLLQDEKEIMKMLSGSALFLKDTIGVNKEHLTKTINELRVVGSKNKIDCENKTNGDTARRYFSNYEQLKKSLGSLPTLTDITNEKKNNEDLEDIAELKKFYEERLKLFLSAFQPILLELELLNMFFDAETKKKEKIKQWKNPVDLLFELGELMKKQSNENISSTTYRKKYKLLENSLKTDLKEDFIPSDKEGIDFDFIDEMKESIETIYHSLRESEPYKTVLDTKISLVGLSDTFKKWTDRAYNVEKSLKENFKNFISTSEEDKFIKLTENLKLLMEYDLGLGKIQNDFEKAEEDLAKLDEVVKDSEKYKESKKLIEDNIKLKREYDLKEDKVDSSFIQYFKDKLTTKSLEKEEIIVLDLDGIKMEIDLRRYPSLNNKKLVQKRDIDGFANTISNYRLLEKKLTNSIANVTLEDAVKLEIDDLEKRIGILEKENVDVNALITRWKKNNEQLKVKKDNGVGDKDNNQNQLAQKEIRLDPSIISSDLNAFLGVEKNYSRFDYLFNEFLKERFKKLEEDHLSKQELVKELEDILKFRKSLKEKIKMDWSDLLIEVNYLINNMSTQSESILKELTELLYEDGKGERYIGFPFSSSLPISVFVMMIKKAKPSEIESIINRYRSLLSNANSKANGLVTKIQNLKISHENNLKRVKALELIVLGEILSRPATSNIYKRMITQFVEPITPKPKKPKTENIAYTFFSQPAIKIAEYWAKNKENSMKLFNNSISKFYIEKTKDFIAEKITEDVKMKAQNPKIELAYNDSNVIIPSSLEEYIKEIQKKDEKFDIVLPKIEEQFKLYEAAFNIKENLSLIEKNKIDSNEIEIRLEDLAQTENSIEDYFAKISIENRNTLVDLLLLINISKSKRNGLDKSKIEDLFSIYTSLGFKNKSIEGIVDFIIHNLISAIEEPLVLAESNKEIQLNDGKRKNDPSAIDLKVLHSKEFIEDFVNCNLLSPVVNPLVEQSVSLGREEELLIGKCKDLIKEYKKQNLSWDSNSLVLLSILQNNEKIDSIRKEISSQFEVLKARKESLSEKLLLVLDRVLKEMNRYGTNHLKLSSRLKKIAQSDSMEEVIKELKIVSGQVIESNLASYYLIIYLLKESLKESKRRKSNPSNDIENYIEGVRSNYIDRNSKLNKILNDFIALGSITKNEEEMIMGLLIRDFNGLIKIKPDLLEKSYAPSLLERITNNVELNLKNKKNKENLDNKDNEKKVSENTQLKKKNNINKNKERKERLPVNNNEPKNKNIIENKEKEEIKNLGQKQKEENSSKLSGREEDENRFIDDRWESTVIFINNLKNNLKKAIKILSDYAYWNMKELLEEDTDDLTVLLL